LNGKQEHYVMITAPNLYQHTFIYSSDAKTNPLHSALFHNQICRLSSISPSHWSLLWFHREIWKLVQIMSLAEKTC